VSYGKISGCEWAMKNLTLKIEKQLIAGKFTNYINIISYFIVFLIPGFAFTIYSTHYIGAFSAQEFSFFSLYGSILFFMTYLLIFKNKSMPIISQLKQHFIKYCKAVVVVIFLLILLCAIIL
jgi:hypothetical protein